ncbi:MAG: tetratricopeptide repeat protein, partial [Chthoniobacterales bacterium]
QWAGEQPGGSRRIDDPSDFVRLEVEYALRRNIPLIPVLVNSTPMPKPETLPAELRELAFRNALPLDSGLDFNGHIERLIRSARKLVGRRGAGARVVRSFARVRSDQTVLVRWAIVGVLAVGFVFAGWLFLRNNPQRTVTITPGVSPSAAAPASPNAATTPPPAKESSRLAAKNDYAAAMDLSVGLHGRDLDEEEAVRLVTRAAGQHLPEAEGRLAYWTYIEFGQLRREGTRTAELVSQALADGLVTAAEKDAGAQQTLGLVYQAGLVSGKGAGDAVPLFQSAADQGDSQAQVSLGLCYQRGSGAIKDPKKAVELYTKAAHAGNVIGQNCLGVCYEGGFGVAKDLNRARELYKTAADRGCDAAQKNLEYLSEAGDNKSEYQKAVSEARSYELEPGTQEYQRRAEGLVWQCLSRALSDCAGGPRSETHVAIVLILSRDGRVRKVLTPPGHFFECIAKKIQPPILPAPPHDSWPIVARSSFVSWNFKERTN